MIVRADTPHAQASGRGATAEPFSRGREAVERSGRPDLLSRRLSGWDASHIDRDVPAPGTPCENP